jgi:DNA-directed RNA polymerase subunit RPC12/RpoP
MRSYKCVVCELTFEGYPNNSWPLAQGNCCDSCNIQVIMARLNGGA